MQFDVTSAGNLPTNAYETIMTHVASHGFVILAPFKLNWPAAQYHAEWMIELHNWCQDNVMDILNAEGEQTIFTLKCFLIAIIAVLECQLSLVPLSHFCTCLLRITQCRA